MKTVIFTDLDDSLLHSERRLREIGEDRSETAVASLTVDGRPICFQTERQAKLSQLLSHADLVIPVTGRSSESLNRVIRPQFSSYRIVSHGALILTPSGVPWSPWVSEIKGEVAEGRHHLTMLFEELEEWREHNETLRHQEERTLRLKFVKDYEHPCYLSVKGPERLISPLAEELKERWRYGIIHHNRRDLAILPTYASKERAVSYLQNHLRTDLESPLMSIGVGDSLSDLPFLSQCDFSLTPRSSMIQHALLGIIER